MSAALSFVIGFGLWTLVEYFIHGILSHRLQGIVARLHANHHRDPRGVFTGPILTAPAALLLYGLLRLALTPALAGWIIAGTVAGFVRYEYVHWRFHFRRPRSAREALLRAHHLAHHRVNPRAYHGVTTRLWDRAFGTLPARWRADYARAAKTEPLVGRSNFRRMYLFRARD